jgi:glutamate-1-semialdehyde 2,1-aminomutase
MNSQNAIVAKYRQLTGGSANLTARAAAVMPGGNTRTTSFYPPYPVVLERAEGPWLWDVDGRRYVDLFCNGLSLIHGNNYAPVRDAIQEALKKGSAWSGTSRAQIAYAELLHERLPALELLRFTNSGSEAAMIAVKAARWVTRRPLIVKSAGAYHGSYPDLEAGLYGQGDLAGRTLVARFNDLDSYEALFERNGRDIAAVVIEPVLVTGRVAAPSPGFLPALEELAHRHGALTILDDCLMLRLAVGGSAERFDLSPDMVTLGKFAGGGTPLGVVGGSRNVMGIFDPRERGAVFHGGSFNGNPVGCAAGQVTLQDLTAERIGRMDADGGRIRAALQERAKVLGLPVDLSGVGSVTGIAFPADPKRHEDDPAAIGVAALFHLACAVQGVLMGPGGIVALSTAHGAIAVQQTIDGLCAALEMVTEFATLGSR